MPLHILLQDGTENPAGAHDDETSTKRGEGKNQHAQVEDNLFLPWFSFLVPGGILSRVLKGKPLALTKKIARHGRTRALLKPIPASVRVETVGQAYEAETV